MHLNFVLCAPKELVKTVVDPIAGKTVRLPAIPTQRDSGIAILLVTFLLKKSDK